MSEKEIRRESLDKVEYWKFASSQIIRVAERGDQLIVGGAAGALILSITFLHDIAPQPSAWSLALLVTSWLSFLVALGTSLLSMRSTEKAFRASLEEGKEYRGRSEDGWNQRTRCQNTAASWLLLLGIALLAVFAVVNLPWSYHAEDSRPARGEREAPVEAAEGATEGARTREEGGGRDDTSATGTAAERAVTGNP